MMLEFLGIRKDPENISSENNYILYVGVWEGNTFFERLSVHTQLLQSCLTLCDPMYGSPPGSSVHGILQQEHWSGLPYLPPGDIPDPGIEPPSLMSPALAGRFFITSATWEAQNNVFVTHSQSCLTLCIPMGCSPLGFSVHGIPSL